MHSSLIRSKAVFINLEGISLINFHSFFEGRIYSLLLFLAANIIDPKNLES